MAKLIYSMITSLDGYAEAAEGDLGTEADDQEVHTFIGDVFRPNRHVPRRPTDVRDRGLLGDRAHRARRASAHPAIRPDWQAAKGSSTPRR